MFKNRKKYDLSWKEMAYNVLKYNIKLDSKIEILFLISFKDDTFFNF